MPNTIDDLLDDMAQQEYSQVKAEFEEIQRIVAGFEETSRFPQIDKALNALPKLSADMDYFTLRELKEKKFPQIREFVNEQLAYEESKRQQRRKLYNQIIAEFKEIKNLKAQLKGKPCDEYTRLLSALPKPFTQDTDYGVMWKVKEETFPQMKAVLKKQQDEETEEAKRRAEEEARRKEEARRRELYPQVKADFEEILKLKAKVRDLSSLTRLLDGAPNPFPSLDTFVKDFSYRDDLSSIKKNLEDHIKWEKDKRIETRARVSGSIHGIIGIFIGLGIGVGVGYVINIIFSGFILAWILGIGCIIGGAIFGYRIGKAFGRAIGIIGIIIFVLFTGFMIFGGIISAIRKSDSSKPASNREQQQTQTVNDGNAINGRVIPNDKGKPVTPADSNSLAPVPPPAFSPTHRVATNDGTNLRLRSSPSTKGEAIMSLPNGSSVQVLQIGDSFVDGDGNAGNWTYVATPEGGKGWCFGAYLKALGN
jgi:hypothetical protein